MIIFLSCGIVVWMLYEVMKRCIRNGKVYINHIFCFIVGLFYYGILPLLLFEFNVKFDDYAYHSVSQMYNTLTLKSKLTYIGILYLIFWCFILGHKVSIFRIGAIQKKQSKQKSFHVSESLWYFPILFLGIFCIFLNRNNLLKGYMEGHNSFKGMFSAFISLNFSLFLLFGFGKIKRNIFRFTPPVIELVKNKWAVTYSVFALFLLSMGGRLYILTNIMAFFIFLSVYYRNGIKIKDCFIASIVILAILGLIGVIRLGSGTPVTLNRILFNMLQESLYESYSFVTYLKNYETMNYASVPTVLMGSFINIIPSIIWKSKINYMKSISDIVPKVQSPLGGMHFYVSFIADAGLIITLIGIVLLGIVLGKIYRNKNKKSDTKNVIYCLVSANLMFTFYRDPVSVSLIKNILENSILIPCFIMIINSIITILLYQNKKIF